MKILMLGAATGNGHISAMDSIYSYLSDEFDEIQLFPDFFENLMPSNRIISDFYNTLLAVSIDMSIIFTNLLVLEKPERFEETYSLWAEALKNFFSMHTCDLIVSTSSLINKYIIRYIENNKLSVKFYIVVTDPFDPLYPGFTSNGADGYFCANETVKKILLNDGIIEEKICVSGYPIHKKFDKAVDDTLLQNILNRDLNSQYPTILINCGAQGAMHFVSIIKNVYEQYKSKANIIVLCGRNKSLYNVCQKNYPEIVTLSFIADIQVILNMSDVCITKAGGNTFYECLYMNCPVLIDASKGLMYQEAGVVDFLEENNVGAVFYNNEDMSTKLADMLQITYLDELKKNICNLRLRNGSISILNYLKNL